MKVLLIDDDPAIHDLIKALLNPLIRLEAYRAIPQNLETLKNSDLIVLDLMLDGESSLAFLKRLATQTPELLKRIILMTAEGSVDDEVEVHRLGLADFVKKPFHPSVLSALIDKHLKLVAQTAAPKTYGPFTVDLVHLEISTPEARFELTPREFKLLKALIEAQGRVLTREQIMEHVWDIDQDTQTRTIDMHISSIRKKIRPYAHMLKTRRGVGIYLDLQATPE